MALLYQLWMEVRDIVQEVGIKIIPKKKKCKKAKWLSEEALQIAVKTDPYIQGKRNPSKMVGTETGDQRADRLKLQSQTTR